MKITGVETIRLQEFANIVWVRLHTDEGLVGLGETFMGAAAVEAYVHETVAAKLIGRDPLQIEGINRDLQNYLGWRSAGVETRGNSAIDIARIRFSASTTPLIVPPRCRSMIGYVTVE